MVVLTCPLPDCTFQTDDVEIAGAAAILNIHAVLHQAAATLPVAQPQPPTPKGPKLERPKIQLNSSPEDWNAFSRRWGTYKTGSGIVDANASGQLLECASPELGNIVLRAHPDFASKPIDEALTILRSLAVVPVALGVLRSELSAMIQDPGETFRTFAAKVQGKAETCEFTTTFSGTCGGCQTEFHGKTYYTDERLRDVLLDGIADNDIRREALSVSDIHNKSINDIIAFVESREIARDANPGSGMSAVSHYRRSQRQSLQNPPPRNVPPRHQSPAPEEKAKTSLCPGCGVTFHLFKKRARGGGWNKKPHTQCADCWKKSQPRNTDSSTTGAITRADSPGDPFGQLTSISAASDPLQQAQGEDVPNHLTTHPCADEPLVVALPEEPCDTPRPRRRHRRPNRRRNRRRPLKCNSTEIAVMVDTPANINSVRLPAQLVRQPKI